MPRNQRIRDPLHDLIEFRCDDVQLEHVLWQVVQTRPFQRLRRIRQLGFSDFVYPGATHSRLLHSLGVFHTARRLMEVIRRNAHPCAETSVQQALAASLVHDLGHGPFSHAFESVGERLGLKMADHEQVSDALKGPLDQINIRTDGGHLMDLAKRSKVVAELETYKLFRIYHSDGDDEAKDKINSTISARITSWQH